MYGLKAKRPQWTITSAKYLTGAEVDRFKRHLASRAVGRRGLITQFILLMLWGTGLRATELCKLTVNETPIGQDVDALHVLGKGGQVRQVWITPELSRLIRWFVREVRPSLVRRPMRKRDYDQPLILSENGRPYDRKLLWRRISRSARRAGIRKRVGVHTQRHTYATGLYQVLGDPILVQKLLGHRDLNTTTVYAQTNATEVPERLQKCDILSVTTHFTDKTRRKPRNGRKLRAR